MSKRRKYILVLIILAAIACWLAGAGAVLALLCLLGLAAIILLFARLYPSNRAKEDQAERDDSF
jgi:hypothetical protein